MELVATKTSATTVDLDLTQFVDTNVFLNISWINGSPAANSVAFSTGNLQLVVLSGPLDGFINFEFVGGQVYTFTYTNAVPVADQVNTPDINVNIASGNFVRWEFEDGGGNPGAFPTFSDGTVIISIAQVQPDKPPVPDFVLPVCVSPPALESDTTDGLQISLVDSVVVATSRTAGFPGAIDVTGYEDWNEFINTYAISFTTDIAGLQNRTDVSTIDVPFPAAGRYVVRASADNSALSSLTVDGNVCALSGFELPGLYTEIEIDSPGLKTIDIVIGNQDTGIPLEEFADNPMGIAFTIFTKPAVALNLRNYENQLVTLKLVNEKNAGYPHTFDFSIPDASDIVVDGVALGGTEYAREELTSTLGDTVVSFTSTAYLYNLDGGDYNYIFSSFSTPDPPPTRQNHRTVCAPDLDGSFVTEIANSRNAGFAGKIDVSGYASWSDFMNANAISFTTSPTNLQGRVDNASVTVNFPTAGSYAVRAAADNGPLSSVTLNGTVCAVGNLDTGGVDTLVSIPAAGDYTLDITIGNQDTGTGPLTTFDENPMGLAFQILTAPIVCEEVPFTETFSGTWPFCDREIFITKNGGNSVTWCFEDGGGINFCDQRITVTLEATRDVVPNTGNACLTAIQNNVWIADSAVPAADGACISQYRDHSTAFTQSRFRIPGEKTSKVAFPGTLCFSDFRGVAGAKTPEELNIPPAP